MPLISQQHVVSVSVAGGGDAKAVEALLKELESYPPVRIIAITLRGIPNPVGMGHLGTCMTAVVETT